MHNYIAMCEGENSKQPTHPSARDWLTKLYMEPTTKLNKGSSLHNNRKLQLEFSQLKGLDWVTAFHYILSLK